MAALGILLVLCAGAFVADVAFTNSLGSQLDMFNTTLDGLTNGQVFLLGAAAGFVLALGLALATAGLSRRSRVRRQHRDALARQRAETERLAAELERERAARRDVPVGTDMTDTGVRDTETTQVTGAPQGDETAVVYPRRGVTHHAAEDDPAYRNG